MLLCAVVALSVIGVASTSNLWTAVLLLGLAAAAHQGWSANLFATVSDLFPKEAVASVVGVGGMLGAVGGMIVATATGIILQYTGSYVALFGTCASAYLFAWLVFRCVVGAQFARAGAQRSL
jgi:ACS family hexuronate transporter-like MFS transporter